MNYLHRELAPISEAAWKQIEQEVRRTFTQWIAGRRVVEVEGPSGLELSAIGTGHLRPLMEPVEGVVATQRQAQLLVEYRTPFAVSRQAVDDVDRGAEDTDWHSVHEAARKAAEAEDRSIFYGFEDGGITGIVTTSAHQAVPLPGNVKQFPDAVALALGKLRLAGVAGPYVLLLPADTYALVSETTEHGILIRELLARVIDGEVIWAPALDGAVLVSTRGGDNTMYLGQDLSIGYLSHDANDINLYLEESFTFIPRDAESSISLPRLDS